MTTKQKPAPNIGDTRQLNSTARMTFAADGWQSEDLVTCCYCTAEEWLPSILDGNHPPTG